MEGEKHSKKPQTAKTKEHKIQEKEKPGPYNLPGLKTYKAAILLMKRFTVKIMPSLLI